MTVYGKRGHFTQTKKIEFFMLIKSYNLSQLSARILEGKTFDVAAAIKSEGGGGGRELCPSLFIAAATFFKSPSAQQL